MWLTSKLLKYASQHLFFLCQQLELIINIIIIIKGYRRSVFLCFSRDCNLNLPLSANPWAILLVSYLYEWSMSIISGHDAKANIAKKISEWTLPFLCLLCKYTKFVPTIFPIFPKFPCVKLSWFNKIDQKLGHLFSSCLAELTTVHLRGN